MGKIRFRKVEEFIIAVGREPVLDDMDRVNCVDAGQPGHYQCGWCDTHDKPRFICGCLSASGCKEG